MIPYLYYDGAIITTVLSDILIVILQIYVINKIGQIPHKKLYYDLGEIIIGSIVLGISFCILNLNMWIAFPVWIIINLTIVYILKFFDDDNKYVIKENLSWN